MPLIHTIYIHTKPVKHTKLRAKTCLFLHVRILQVTTSAKTLPLTLSHEHIYNRATAYDMHTTFFYHP